MKALKNIFLGLLATAMVFGFASCKNDDDDDTVIVKYVTLEFANAAFADGKYTATDPDLDDVTWDLTLSGSDWELQANYPAGSAGTTTIYGHADYYKGTFTTDGDKIILTKTHHGDLMSGWVAYSSAKSKWKTGTLADSKISIKFTKSDLSYKTATGQSIVSITELAR